MDRMGLCLINEQLVSATWPRIHQHAQQCLPYNNWSECPHSRAVHNVYNIWRARRWRYMAPKNRINLYSSCLQLEISQQWWKILDSCLNICLFILAAIFTFKKNVPLTQRKEMGNVWVQKAPCREPESTAVLNIGNVAGICPSSCFFKSTGGDRYNITFIMTNSGKWWAKLIHMVQCTDYPIMAETTSKARVTNTIYI